MQDRPAVMVPELSDHLQQIGQDTAKFFGMTEVKVEGRKAMYDIYD